MSSGPPCFSRPDRCACSSSQSGPVATTRNASCSGPAPYTAVPPPNQLPGPNSASTCTQSPATTHDTQHGGTQPCCVGCVMIMLQAVLGQLGQFELDTQGPLCGSHSPFIHTAMLLLLLLQLTLYGTHVLCCRLSCLTRPCVPSSLPSFTLTLARTPSVPNAGRSAVRLLPCSICSPAATPAVAGGALSCMPPAPPAERCRPPFPPMPGLRPSAASIGVSKGRVSTCGMVVVVVAAGCLLAAAAPWGGAELGRLCLLLLLPPR